MIGHIGKTKIVGKTDKVYDGATRIELDRASAITIAGNSKLVTLRPSSIPDNEKSLYYRE